MSQAFHQGLFGFDRQHQPDQQHQDMYAPADAANVWSEMFNNFTTSSGISATDLLANQMPGGYRLHRTSPVTAAAPGFGGDGWYGGATAHRDVVDHDDNSTVLQVGASSGGGLCLSPVVDKKQNHHHALPGQLNAGSAAAMQLVLMNPQHHVQQPRTPSAPPPVPQAIPLHHDYFQANSVPSIAGGGGEGGLSLSLISPFQQLQAAKAVDLRDGSLHYNGHNPVQLQGQQQYHQPPLNVGTSMAVMSALRHSKYARAAQEVLEEFCNVGGGQMEGSGKRRNKAHSTSSNPNDLLSPTTPGAAAAVGWGGSPSSSKEPPPLLSPSDRFDQQRRKAKLLSMFDELEKRYNHYREQMQGVVNCFDTAMGFGAAAPYTGLAQKAMSRHFRCLKDAIAAQLKRTCMLLGDKDGGVGSGITKGETPRLRILDQNLRQQRSTSSFHHMGIMMDQEPWRPQRGLPERSVSILRAWLFEHFLHPYPSDGDKHLLARQTGLTRNQVSNWFINARVRLWKPMIEDMYLQEAKQEEDEEGKEKGGRASSQAQAHNPEAKTAETRSGSHSIASLSSSIHKHEQHRPFASPSSSNVITPLGDVGGGGSSASGHYSAGGVLGSVRFGASAGDVTLTLGLRHAGNMADNSTGGFSLGDLAGR